MAKKTEKISIGATQYTITQVGAVEGRKLYKKLITALGPVLRDAFSGHKADGDVETRAIGLVLRGIEELPLDLFEELCEAFSAECLVKVPGASVAVPLNTDSVFDNHFAGDYGGMTNWLMACLKLNFASFLAGKASSANNAVAPEPSP